MCCASVTASEGRGFALHAGSRCVPVLLAVALLLGAAPALAQAIDDYDRLIVRARVGDTEPALTVLRRLGERASRRQQFDHILIASWADKPEEVVAVYERLPLDPAPPPADVQQAVARALRDLKRWPEALTIWRTGLHQYPQEQAVFASGFTMTLVDAGQGLLAIQTGLNWVERIPKSADLRLALAYAYASQEQAFDALFHTDQALRLAPNMSWVQREHVLALQRAGLSEQALVRAQQYPAYFSAAQIRALQGDVAALKTRLAATPTRSEAERFVIADRALALYDELIAAWQALGQEADADLRRVRIDRLNALHARARMADVVQAYETLADEGVPIPTWALTNVASAYLYERRPERARDVYRAVLADIEALTPDEDREKLGPAAARLDNEIGLLYALIEAEQFEDIAPVLSRIQSYQPAWLYLKGNPQPKPNPRYLDAQRAVAAASMAADDTSAAQAQTEDMVAHAPNNSTLRADLAGVYRARAQPRRAEIELKLAETITPRALLVENGQGLVALDLQEWRQAEVLSADTMARYPEDQITRRLARLWEVHKMAELRVNSHLGLASDSPVRGRDEWGIDAVLYSAPIAYNWRGFAGLGYAQGKYAEGDGHYHWQRSGVEWRSRDWWIEGELAANRYGHGVKLGLRLSAAFDLNDGWQIGASAARLSRQTPLRALHSDISAHALQTYARWRANERREWRLTLSPMRFSDGNDRWLLTLDGRERLYTRAHWNVDLLLDAATQTNSQDSNQPYFNPKRDLMLLPALRGTQILHRRYENVWEHFATLSVGAYWQRRYGTSAVMGLAYGQRYRYNDVFEMGASIQAISRPYDGERERELRLLLDLVSRF